jgi:hypothetical protein
MADTYRQMWLTMSYEYATQIKLLRMQNDSLKHALKRARQELHKMTTQYERLVEVQDGRD